MAYNTNLFSYNVGAQKYKISMCVCVCRCVCVCIYSLFQLPKATQFLSHFDLLLSPSHLLFPLIKICLIQPTKKDEDDLPISRSLT